MTPSFSHPTRPTMRAALLSLMLVGFGPSCGAPDSTSTTLPALSAGPRQPPPSVVWDVVGRLGDAVPVLDERTVYFLGPPHEVTAVDRATGALRWNVSLPVARAQLFGHGLALAGGKLVVGDFDVFGLEPSTGAIAWQFRPSVGRQAGFGKLTTDNGVVYTGSTGGHVFAIDASTGVLRWKAALVDDTLASVFDPVVRDGTVFASVSQFPTSGSWTVGFVAAVDAQSGAVRWMTALPSRKPGSPSLTGTGTSGTVVIGSVAVTASNEGVVFGLDRATGSIEWTGPRATPPPGYYGGPNPLEDDLRRVTAEGDVAYLGSNLGTVSAFAADGRLLWEKTAERGSIFALSADATFVYATHFSGQLAAFSRATGELMWLVERGALRRTTDEALLFPPATDGEQVFVGGDIGAVYRLQMR